MHVFRGVLFRSAAVGAWCLVLALGAGSAHALPNNNTCNDDYGLPGGLAGYSGREGFTCTGCHTPETGGYNYSPVIAGAAKVVRSSLTTYTVQFNKNSGTTAARAGFNLAVGAGAGTLSSTDGNVQTSGTNELTHNHPTSPDGSGNFSWSVRWTAPSSAGSHTFYVCANPVNNNATNSADGCAGYTGDGTIACTTRSIVVNAQPVVSSVNFNATYTENGAAVVIDNSINVTDADDTSLASATVSITGNYQSGQDQLSCTTPLPAGISSCTFSAVTGVLTLSGSATVANYESALEGVKYQNTSENPSTATRTISFVVSDSVESSLADTTTLTVVAVNDAPVLTATGGTTAFSEGGGAVAIDTGITVADVDNSTLASATVSITGNFASGEDVLGFTNAGMGNIAGSYSAGTGVLTLTSAGATATLAQWQLALRAVTYNNTSVSPSTANRTISFTANDGADPSSTVTKIVTVNSTNSLPAIGNLGGDGVTYNEDDPPVLLDAGTAASVTDIDSADFDTGSLTVSITANGTPAEDVLGIDTSGTVSLSAGTAEGSIVSVGGTAVGAIAAGGTGTTEALVIAFGAGATPALATTLVRALTYSNSDTGTPSTATRTVSVEIDDGDGGSAAVSTTVAVVTVNDAPQITSSADTSATDGEPYSYPVDVNDPDDTTLTYGLSGEPAGMTVSAAGLVEWTPPCADADQFANGYAAGPITVTVTDGGSEGADPPALDDEQTWTITVDVPDSDGDQMPDCFENANGLDPDTDDAAEDPDGDGRVNLDEFLGGFDPNLDDVPPVVTAPGDLVVPATGYLTAVDLGEPAAFDVLDGALDASPDVQSPFRPGRHTITWSAEDTAGNIGTAEQAVDVLPLANFNVAQTSGEGTSVNVTVMLNGDPPAYPVTVDYTVGGTAAQPADHDAVAGTATINSGTSATIPVAIVSDGVTEPDETVVFTMTSLANAVAGLRATHTLTIVDRNVAPRVSLSLMQAAEPRAVVYRDQGTATVASMVADPNPGDGASYDWSGSDNALALGSETGDSVAIDPLAVSAGAYLVRLGVTDTGGATGSAQLMLVVRETAPALSVLDDSDGDGVDDLAEGVADSDGDGIPDYRDALDEPSVLPNQTGDPPSARLLETEPGLFLRLGATALAAGRGGALISPEDVSNFGGNGGGVLNGADTYENNGGLFDFEIHGVAPGGIARVVVPLQATIRPGAVYRKFTPAAGWHDFVSDTNNAVASAFSTGGLCPGPASGDYEPGLVAFRDCVRLTLQDGGPNDADGTADGVIRDPGGVAVAPVPASGGRRGGGPFLAAWLALVLATVGLLRGRRTRG